MATFLAKKHWQNPWVFYLPFLVLYLFVVIVLRDRIMSGDAGRYLMYAENLCQGYYAPKDNFFIWNGPGYPLVLMPFVAFNLPLITIACFNAVLLYLAHVLLFKALRFYVSINTALVFGTFWALHFSTYELLPIISTEIFTIFLVSLIIYFSISVFAKSQASISLRKPIWILGFLFGLLVLTKVIFAYVLLLLLPLVVVAYFFKRDRKNTLKTLYILGIAFLVNLPYLIYTYNLTGRYLFCAKSGGVSLYWMSTPHSGEYGDWQSSHFQAFKGRDVKRIEANHRKDFEKMEAIGERRIPGLKADDLFKKMAIENIKNHPKKYLVNCVANVNRLFFGFPNSYQDENLKFLKYTPNIIFIPLILYSLFIVLVNFRKVPYEFKFLLLVSLIYLGLSVLVSTFPRMFLVIAPVFVWLISYTVYQTVQMRIFFR